MLLKILFVLFLEIRFLSILYPFYAYLVTKLLRYFCIIHFYLLICYLIFIFYLPFCLLSVRYLLEGKLSFLKPINVQPYHIPSQKSQKCHTHMMYRFTQEKGIQRKVDFVYIFTYVQVYYNIDRYSKHVDKQKSCCGLDGFLLLIYIYDKLTN